MIVRTARGRKGDTICDIDGILCLFPRKMVQPEPGIDLEVMITHHPNPIWPDLPSDAPDEVRQANPPKIGFLFVAPVTDDHVLVSHKGFECSGSMCRTTASVDAAGDAAVKSRSGRTVGWLTPGRSPVIETDNVNVGWSYLDRKTGEYRKQEHCDPIPGLAYVSLADLRDGKNRVCGLPDLTHVDPRILAMLKRRTRTRPEAAE